MSKKISEEALMVVLNSIKTMIALEYRNEETAVKCTMSKDDFETCELILRDLENESDTIKIKKQ